MQKENLELPAVQFFNNGMLENAFLERVNESMYSSGVGLVVAPDFSAPETNIWSN